ncbi:MAG TPA: phosphoribosylglycinamide formyltransferase [Candidatus Omnitrophota bacterium]|nr:phosphoribosylglycinamide formyltransferase [Candidatus Omnitrophota bacterium]
MNIAVFASGTGSNFAAIASAVRRKQIPAKLALLVCDNPRAKVMSKAKRAGIEVFLIDRDSFKDKRSFEKAIIARLKQARIGCIALAGFMRILSPEFVRAFKNRIINIHPALLPAFKGGHGIADAFAYGVKVTGVTVHFVDEHMDHGPIIMQEAVPVREHDTLASLEAAIHRVEHRLYPHAIRLFVQGRLKVRGRNVVITK